MTSAPCCMSYAVCRILAAGRCELLAAYCLSAAHIAYCILSAGRCESLSSHSLFYRVLGGLSIWDAYSGPHSGWTIPATFKMVYFGRIQDSLFWPHHTILLPLAVILNLAPSISAALRHISIRCRKISKYSSMEQIFSSICRFNVISFLSLFTLSFASVTA